MSYETGHCWELDLCLALDVVSPRPPSRPRHRDRALAASSASMAGMCGVILQRLRRYQFALPIMCTMDADDGAEHQRVSSTNTALARPIPNSLIARRLPSTETAKNGGSTEPGDDAAVIDRALSLVCTHSSRKLTMINT